MSEGKSSRSIFQRVGWAVADQAVSSGTNFAVGLLLARTLGPEGFGAFAIGFAAWLFVIGIVRTLLVQPYVIESASLAPEQRAIATTNVTGAVTTVSGLFAVALGVLALAGPFSSALSGVLLAVALTFPATLLQDVWRYVGFASGRPDRAALNDTVWAATQVVALGTLWATNSLSAATATLAWGGSAGVAALFGLWQFSIAPSFNARTLAWSKQAAKVGGWFTLSNLIYSASGMAITAVIAARVSPAGVGGMRAVQNLYAPYQLLSNGSESVILPEEARAAAIGYAPLRRVALLHATALLAVAALYVGLVVVGGAPLLGLVFGKKFEQFAELLLPMGLSALLGGAVSSAALGLRAMKKGRLLATAQAPTAILKVVLCVIFVNSFGLVGAAWGLVIGNGAHAGILWIVLWMTTGPASPDVEAGGSRRVEPPDRMRD